ncbi:MAG: hypothetical protein WCV84_04100 [Patescibacteria group bacterium]
MSSRSRSNRRFATATAPVAAVDLTPAVRVRVLEATIARVRAALLAVATCDAKGFYTAKPQGYVPMELASACPPAALRAVLTEKQAETLKGALEILQEASKRQVSSGKIVFAGRAVLAELEREAAALRAETPEAKAAEFVRALARAEAEAKRLAAVEAEGKARAERIARKGEIEAVAAAKAKAAKAEAEAKAKAFAPVPKSEAQRAAERLAPQAQREAAKADLITLRLQAQREPEPAGLVLDPKGGDFVTPEELERRTARRAERARLTAQLPQPKAPKPEAKAAAKKPRAKKPAAKKPAPEAKAAKKPRARKLAAPDASEAKAA